MKINLLRHRPTLVIVVALALALGALALMPFVSASCNAMRPSSSPQMSEADAIVRLRTMAHGATLPAESAVAEIEAQHPNTRAGMLARILRSRIRSQAGNHAGAASLLEAISLRSSTSIGDYALFMRAAALEQAGRRVEARAAFEQLAREFPDSLRARDATLRGAQIALQDGAAGAVPLFVKPLADRDDAAALLLTARAYEQIGDGGGARAAHRRIYFYAPASTESVESAARLQLAPNAATADESIARANKLYEARRYREAADAYADAFSRFPQTITAQTNLRRGIAAFNAGRHAEAVAPLRAVPVAFDGETRSEALYYLAQTHAKLRQWSDARSVTEELRRAYTQSQWTPRALVSVGTEAKTQNNSVEANNFFRAAVTAYPNIAATAGAQFELAWAAHTAGNFANSSQLLIEHLANYADKNTDNRGRAGYWAARDAERAGREGDARALYAAMQQRYEANWYGYLAKQGLDRMGASQTRTTPAPDSPLLARAVANLNTVTVAEETISTDQQANVARADELATVGLDDWAFEELNKASEAAPDSPRINLAIARLRRLRGENVLGINTLRRSYPDYAQMKLEEMTREEWDVFYPLAYWDTIKEQARLRSLDPFMVAGLIRQESVFDPRAASSAQAYGLMQLLVPTGQAVARRNNIERTITADTLFEPRLNIQLGTAYMRDQLTRFGRVEYLAAAYNAGPGRAVQWRANLPAPIDEWAEAVPFRETRGYIQGVVRNMLQYRRLYDMDGQFRSEVGARPVRPATNTPAETTSPPNNVIRPRRANGGGDEEE